MRVVDDGSSRGDLQARRELKYALPFADVDKLLALFDGSCSRLRFGSAPISVVRSIYFDDARLSACRENLAGLSRRQKLRLRWYDALQTPSKFFMEVKWRNSNVSGKHRLEIEAEEPLHSRPYVDIVQDLVASAPERFAGVLGRMCEPVVMVEYKRAHFAAPDGVARITVDHDLRFYDQMGRVRPSTEFPQAMEGFVVIEAKVPVGQESAIFENFYPMRLRPTRCSKYVHACQTLGLLAGVATSDD